MSRVFVLGNAGMDLSLGMVRLPMPGETLVADTVARAPGGKGLNQAVVAARAGADVIFMAPLGQDSEAARLREALGAEPLSFEPLVLDCATDLSVIMVTPEGENSIVTAGLAAEGLSADEAAGFARRVREEDWLLLQGNLSLAATRAAMEACAGSILFNTAPLRWPVETLLPLCQLVIANAVEAECITACREEAAAERLLALGARRAIITLGGEGAILAERDGLVRVSAPQVSVIDSTGAGDTLCGVLAAGLARGLTLPQALAQAQRAAADTVTRAGAFAALPGRASLRQSWEAVEKASS